jgi:hypothetical protein
MSEITLVMAIYGQPLMLQKQVDTIKSYPDHVLDDLSIVIVDDHGEPPVDVGLVKSLTAYVRDVQLFRITENIPWNQMGARNLGMVHADGWCLMVDPDMVFQADVMHRIQLAAEKLSPGHVVRYQLKHVSSGKLDASSPNTYLIHSTDFIKVGGYDEDYAGNKGWSDVQLLDVLNAHYKMHSRPDLWADFYSKDQISDASVNTLDRSTGANRKKRLKKVDQARACGGWRKWVTKHKSEIRNLRFGWTRLVPSTDSPTS